MFGKRSGSENAKRRRIDIHEMTRENDIRYRGPLHFQHFQALGWLCIVISQIVLLIKLGGRFDSNMAADTAAWAEILDNIANLSLPFLLIASFAIILDTSKGYMTQLVKNGAATVAIFGLFCAVFYRYIVGSFEAFLKDPAQALPAVQSVIDQAAPYGFVAFNIFVDLFLCTLTMFFLNYTPRRVFTGKACILFRLLALLPIAYEVGCMLLKIRSAMGLVKLPVWSFPLLTVKPPMTFLLFVVLALFVKTRELRFRRHGKTHEEYTAFLQTNRNAWHFSVFLAIMLVVISFLDFAVVIGFTTGNTVQSTLNSAQELAAQEELGEDKVGEKFNELIQNEELLEATAEKSMKIGLAVGFGGSVYLFLLAPVVLLFSYTRKPKFGLLGLLIPVAGIFLILIVYLEGAHQLLFQLPIEKVDLNEIKELTVLYSSILQ